MNEIVAVVRWEVTSLQRNAAPASDEHHNRKYNGIGELQTDRRVEPSRNQRLEATSGGDAICITELLRITTHKAANTGRENLLTTITRRSDDGHR